MTTGTSNPPVRQVAGPVPHVSATRPTQLQPTMLVPRAQTYRLDVPRLRRVGEARDTWAMFRYDASQALPKIQYPPSCFTGNLDSLNIHETAASAGAPNLFGRNPRGIYPSTNADTKCRHALRCPDELQQSQSGWKNVAGSARKGGSVTQPRRCVTLYLDVRFHSASPPPLQLT
jgi:hypothetical protein